MVWRTVRPCDGRGGCNIVGTLLPVGIGVQWEVVVRGRRGAWMLIDMCICELDRSSCGRCASVLHRLRIRTMLPETTGRMGRGAGVSWRREATP